MESEVEARGVHHEGLVVHEVFGAEEPLGLAFWRDHFFKAFHGHIEVEFEPCAAMGPLVKPHATRLAIDPNKTPKTIQVLGVFLFNEQAQTRIL